MIGRSRRLIKPLLREFCEPGAAGRRRFGNERADVL
jgi:hypothetical protein